MLINNLRNLVLLAQEVATREAAGERFDEVELNILVQQVWVTTNRGDAAERAPSCYAIAPSGLIVNVPSRPEEILDAPYCLIGTVARIVEQLQERHERCGLSYITVHGGFADALARLWTDWPAFE